MGEFFIFIFFYFLFLYLIIYILGMIIGRIPTKEITRNRKRPKKTSTNFIIAREVFDG
jgi:Na+-transporting methylmalonyl-CoA/oxaloacetate decarboxylase gamma subunit